MVLHLLKKINPSRLIARQKHLSPYEYRHTPFLPHHSLQSIFLMMSRKQLQVTYEREKIFFEDGGHICLDWVNKHPTGTI